MRMCDRKGCQERQADTIILQSQGSEIDLCPTCLNDVMELIKTGPPLKPKKKGKK